MGHKKIDWRGFLAVLPLPTLALAASYGVYTFNLLFVPDWVALVSAAAFELTYVGLAVARLAEHQRRRGTIIAASAVAVSVLYNVAAGLFHRRPDLLINPPLWGDVILAVMHGLPLAIVAYNVASLLLHGSGQEHEHEHTPAPNSVLDAAPALSFARLGELPPQPTYPTPVKTHFNGPDVETSRNEPTKAHEREYHCKRCGAGPMPFSQLGRHSRSCKADQA